MNESVFRLAVIIILGIVAYWVVKAQMVIVQALTQPKGPSVSNSPDNHEILSSGRAPIGFKQNHQ